MIYCRDVCAVILVMLIQMEDCSCQDGVLHPKTVSLGITGLIVLCTDFFFIANIQSRVCPITRSG